MDALLLTGILLLAGIGGFLLYSLLLPHSASGVQRLVPFSVLPVQEASPSVRAHLELLAGQIAWMDSAVMQSMVLVYPDGNAEAAELCREMARQYAFFSCMSLTETQQLLTARMQAAQVPEKNFADGCNFKRNVV